MSHAHDAISTLLEAITDGAEFPLVLNKYEGDAALMYADTNGNPKAAVNDVSRQVFGLFGAFKTKVADLAADRSKCPCDACQNIGNLRLKAIAHLGTAAFRNAMVAKGSCPSIVNRLVTRIRSAPPINHYILR